MALGIGFASHFRELVSQDDLFIHENMPRIAAALPGILVVGGQAALVRRVVGRGR